MHISQQLKSALNHADIHVGDHHTVVNSALLSNKTCDFTMVVTPYCGVFTVEVVQAPVDIVIKEGVMDVNRMKWCAIRQPATNVVKQAKAFLVFEATDDHFNDTELWTALEMISGGMISDLTELDEVMGDGD
jgi:hypothetical protein